MRAVAPHRAEVPLRQLVYVVAGEIPSSQGGLSRGSVVPETARS